MMVRNKKNISKNLIIKQIHKSFKFDGSYEID